MSFATYFEWDIRPEGEDAFKKAWEDVTQRLLHHGSNGSALFRTDEGHFAALARWPSQEARDRGFAAADLESEGAAMAQQIVQTIHRIDLEGVSDLWTWPKP